MTRSNNSRRGIQKLNFAPNKHTTILVQQSARSARYQLAADADDFYDYADDGYDFESSDEEYNGYGQSHLLLLNDSSTLPLALSSDSGVDNPDWLDEWTIVSSGEESVASDEASDTFDWVKVDTPNAEKRAECHGESTTSDQAIADLLSADELAMCEFRLGSPKQRRNPPSATSSIVPAVSSSIVPAVGRAKTTRTGSAGIAQFPSASFGRDRRPKHRLPSRHHVDALAERLGACIVCSDSVATVVMEPCGHLALCGACYDSWAKTCGARHVPCVYCRTPGTPIQLLSRADGGDSMNVCIRLSDGLVTTSSVRARHDEGDVRKLALDYKRAKRRVARDARSRPDAQSIEEDHDGWVQYGQALDAWKRKKAERRALLAAVQSADQATRNAAMEEFKQNCGQFHAFGRMAWWRNRIQQSDVPLPLVVKLLNMPLRRPDIPVLPGPSTHAWSSSSQKEKRWMSSQKQMLRLQLNKQRLDHRQFLEWRAEQHKSFVLAAGNAIATAISLVDADTACIGCGRNEACMLAYPCQHLVLCRPCWEAMPRENEVCAQCGMQSEYALCIRRP